MSIQIQVEMDSYGGLIAQPVREDYRKRIIKYLQQWTVVSDGSVYLQNAEEIDWFMQTFVPLRKRCDLKRGWPVKCNVNAWDFAYLYGWDLHSAPGVFT